MKSYFFLFYLFLSIYCRTKEEWKSRVIYQIITDRFALGDGSRPSCSLSTYCGGNFKGIQKNLSYLKSLGVSAIWISPIVENIEGAYHGYWASNIYNINPHFGTEQDLKDLIASAHSIDIWVMVDVVANHVGLVGDDFSKIFPFNKPEHYHSKCQINQEDFTKNQWRVENCRLADLPDLDQSNSFVKSTLISWIANLVRTYNLDGIRIDTIPEVPKAFWAEFSKAAGVFQIGEVFDGRVDYVSDYQNYIDATINYPLYFKLKDIYIYGHGMNELEGFYGNDIKKWKDPSVLGVFVDNHDNARFLSLKSDYAAFKGYILLTLSSMGIPILYYGSEQGFSGGDDPKNREPIWNNFNQNHELYLFIQKILGARGKTEWYKYEQIQRYSDQQFYAFSRGTSLFLSTNQKNQVVKTISYHPYKNGDVICNIFWYDSDCITVQNGQFTVYLTNGESKIYVIKGSLKMEKIEAPIGILSVS